MQLTPDIIKKDGNWGMWSEFGACSHPCGKGLQFRTRACDNPRCVYLSVCLFIQCSICLSVCLSVYLSICLSIHLSVGPIFSYIANFFPLLLTSSSPANGGRICSGPGYQFQICNAHECEDPYLDYRADQCSMMDNKFEYQNTWHHWLSLWTPRP